MNDPQGSRVYLPPKLLLAKLFAANELAAYRGYASTRKVKMPLKTRRVLQVPSGQRGDDILYNTTCINSTCHVRSINGMGELIYTGGCFEILQN